MLSYNLPDGILQNEKIKKLSIHAEKNIFDALKLMDGVDSKILLVFKNETFIGVISIGDIQRAIIKDFNLTTPIANILRTNFTFAFESDPQEKIKEIMLEKNIALMPILNNKKELVDIIFWNQLFNRDHSTGKTLVDIPVIIMAGGQGTRLKPLTNMIPKPLIPIGNTTIIDEIIQKFKTFGVQTFLISLNYKGDLIKDHLISNQDQSTNFKFFKEDQPLGTIGSLSLMENDIPNTFILSNCDILIKEDYNSILNFHRQAENDVTIVGAINSISIPYGVLETSKDGLLTKFNEKPNFNFLVNSGMYIIEKNIIELIPKDNCFNLNELIEVSMAQNKKIGVFPVSQKAWIDIGQLDDYFNLIKSQNFNL